MRKPEADFDDAEHERDGRDHHESAPHIPP
jgi:hypothetical protein